MKLLVFVRGQKNVQAGVTWQASNFMGLELFDQGMLARACLCKLKLIVVYILFSTYDVCIMKVCLP